MWKGPGFCTKTGLITATTLTQQIQALKIIFHYPIDR